ncbi:MAG: DUF3131 domain-containing protein [Candidatus Bathyarchaeia archaeon]
MLEGMKFRTSVVFAVIMVVVVASQGLWLAENSSVNQVIQNPPIVDSTAYWMSLATNAWQYFQVGNGVNSATGLHASGQGYPYFTDWDLGVYIQAIIDAEKLGIISNNGTYGADWRFNKILAFLETRPLTSDGQPYDRYCTDDGQNQDDSVQVATDAGNLLVALNNLKDYRPDLASSIDYIVYNRTNYGPECEVVSALAGSVNIYDYYVACGFADFWPSQFSSEANTILNNIVNAPAVETYGVALPEAKVTSELLLLSIFNFQQPAAGLLNLSRQVYLAEEARYNATGKYTAFSEGNIGGVNGVTYVWEWVVLPNGSTWVIEKDETSVISVTPVVYLKVAVGLDAIYNTNYTQSMVDAIEPVSLTNSGYRDGVNENGQVVSTVIDKTNGLILAAALYAINNNVSAPYPSLVSSQSKNWLLVA